MTRTAILWAVILTVIVTGFMYLVEITSAQTPEPAPNLSYSKIAGPDVPVGGAVVYTLRITNSGYADSGSQTIEDQLDEDVDWTTAFENGLDCNIDSDNLLTCFTESVPKRALVEGTETFANGVASVTVYGTPDTCGEYTNEAVFYSGRTFAGLREASVEVQCPATPTNTPQATPTQTSTMPIPATNTSTPGQHTATPESTPTTRIVPLPPNTGSGPGSSAPISIVLITALTLMSVGIGVGIYGRKQYSH